MPSTILQQLGNFADEVRRTELIVALAKTLLMVVDGCASLDRRSFLVQLPDCYIDFHLECLQF